MQKNRIHIKMYIRWFFSWIENHHCNKNEISIYGQEFILSKVECIQSNRDIVWITLSSCVFHLNKGLFLFSCTNVQFIFEAGLVLTSWCISKTIRQNSLFNNIEGLLRFRSNDEFRICYGRRGRHNTFENIITYRRVFTPAKNYRL